MPPLQPPVVGPAQAADLASLQELARRTIDANYRSFLGDAGVDAFITSGASDAHIETQFRKGHVRAMKLGDQVVALAILDGPTIDLMMVDARRHRQGLGRTLLTRAEDVLFTEHEEIRLESFAENDTANAFYAACGWTEVGHLDSAGFAKVEFTKRRHCR